MLLQFASASFSGKLRPVKFLTWLGPRHGAAIAAGVRRDRDRGGWLHANRVHHDLAIEAYVGEALPIWASHLEAIEGCRAPIHFGLLRRLVGYADRDLDRITKLDKFEWTEALEDGDGSADAIGRRDPALPCQGEHRRPIVQSDSGQASE